MVGMRIRKHASRAGFHHQVHGPEHWYLRRSRVRITFILEKVRGKHIGICFKIQFVVHFFQGNLEVAEHFFTDVINITLTIHTISYQLHLCCQDTAICLL